MRDQRENPGNQPFFAATPWIPYVLMFPSHGRGRRFNPYSAHHYFAQLRLHGGASCACSIKKPDAKSVVRSASPSASGGSNMIEGPLLALYRNRTWVPMTARESPWRTGTWTSNASMSKLLETVQFLL